MGYSHYWNVRSSLTEEEFTDLQLSFMKLKKQAKCTIEPEKVCGWISYFIHESEKEPLAHQDAICFNGVDDDRYETFMLVNSQREFNSCKTAERPYDEMVTAVLLYAAAQYPKWITVRTDGAPQDWQAAIDLIAATFDEQLTIDVNDKAEIVITDVNPTSLETKKRHLLEGAFS